MFGAFKPKNDRFLSKLNEKLEKKLIVPNTR